MEDEFEEIYNWANEKINKERENLNEFKKDIRQSEGLIIGIIVLCIIISVITKIFMAKLIFITVAVMMFVFGFFYTFKYERRITDKQNKFSEYALSEMVVHIKDGFVYEKDEEIPGNYYRKSGFNRIYKELNSHGVISGTRNNHEISLSNIIVKNETKELFRGIFAYGTLNKEYEEIDIMRVNSNNNKKEKFELPHQGLFMYSEKTTNSRKIIDDNLIEKLEKFKNTMNIKFEIMINKNLVFFRFFDNKILTEPIINDKKTKEYLYEYYKIIEFASNFITDIESKEQ